MAARRTKAGTTGTTGGNEAPPAASAPLSTPKKPRAAKVSKPEQAKKPAKARTAATRKPPVKTSPAADIPAPTPSRKPGTATIKNPITLTPKELEALETANLHGLDARQARFVDLWLVSYSAAQAYREAGYKCKNDNVAAVGASKLLRKVKHHPYTQARQVELFARTADVQNQILGVVHAASFADPRELVEYVRRCCRCCYGKDHKHQLRPSEMLARREQYEIAKAEAAEQDKVIGPFDEMGGVGYNATRKPNPACPECDGEGYGHVLFKDTSDLSPAALAIYEGVKEGKDGTEIKVASQKGYRELLAKLFNMSVEPTVAAVNVVTDEQLDEIMSRAEKNTEANKAAMLERAQELAQIGIVN
jgi:hypothetical protein